MMKKRDIVLAMPAGFDLDVQVASMMEFDLPLASINELRSQNRKTEWYSVDRVDSPNGWWKASVGTDALIKNGFYLSHHGEELAVWEPAREYSSDIEAAWGVVLEMLKKGYQIHLTSHETEWICSFNKPDYYEPFHAETAPLAICRAALLTTLESGTP